MLFDKYDSVYIEEDKKTIHTGDWKGFKDKGFVLDNVTVEEIDSEYLIHGFKREYTYLYHDNCFKKDLRVYNDSNFEEKYCLSENDYRYEKHLFVDSKFPFIYFKSIRYLKNNYYLHKERDEVCISVFKDRLVEIYSK